MPREGLHWLILSQSLVGEEGNSTEAANICKECLPYAQLGAIAHDAPYFLGRGAEHPFQIISEDLHGKEGEDTLEPLRLLGKKISLLQPQARRPAVAFLLGMLSHCVVDWIFHPLIFYYTGDYYHKIESERLNARTRHRRFEVYLDSYFIEKPFTIAQIVADCSEHLESITVLLSHVASKFSNAQALWHKSIHDFAFCQKAMLSPIPGAAVRFLKILGLRRVAQFDAMARFGRTHAPPYFSDKFVFLHPVTGVEQVTTLDEMRLLAINECRNRYDDWCRFFLNMSPAPEEVGKSLSFGMIKTRADEAKYFANQFEV